VILLPSEKGTFLNLSEAEAPFVSFYRASQSITISSDTITIPGSGRYKILPQTGTSDQITSIVLTAEAVEGTLIQLRPQTAGHTVTVVHGGNLHLAGGINAVMTSVYSTVWLRHHGSNVWAQEGFTSDVP
jgi:hypothetical protein